MEVPVWSTDPGDWTQAKHNKLPEFYKVVEEEEPKAPEKVPVAFDELDDEENDPLDDVTEVPQNKELARVRL